MLDQIVEQIKQRHTPPTRADVAQLLSSIGAPSEKQTAKTEQVTALFDRTGYNPHNFQGHHVTTDLESFVEF